MNSCTCPNPPGGKVDCPDDHVAICRVVNGVAQAECIPPDTTLSEEGQTLRFLEIITRRSFTTLGSTELTILRSGEYKSPDGSMHVLFKIPVSGATGGGGARAA